MTAPIVETPVAPPTGTQLSWEESTPEAREAALRGDDLPPEPTPEPPKETPPVEPPETPPALPPVKAEEPPETPPVEEPAEPVVEPPEEEPERLYFGKYKNPAELEQGYLELMETLDKQATELGDLRPLKVIPKPEPEDPEPVRDILDETSLKAHDEWMLREIGRTNKASEDRITQSLRQYETAQPVREMIKQFTLDHPDISPEKQLTIGQHADNMARVAGKPVSLEEAHADLFGATTETPSKPKEPPKDKDTAESIQAANALPKTVSDVPTSPPADVGGTGSEALSQAEWDALTQAERDKRMRDIPDAPKE